MLNPVECFLLPTILLSTARENHTTVQMVAMVKFLPPISTGPLSIAQGFLGFPNMLLPFSPTLMWKLYFLPNFDQTTSLPHIQQKVSPLTMQDLNFLPPNLITYITWSKANCFEDSSAWWKCNMTQKALEDNESLYWKAVKELTKRRGELISEHIARFSNNCFYHSFPRKSGPSWQLSVILFLCSPQLHLNSPHLLTPFCLLSSFHRRGQLVSVVLVVLLPSLTSVSTNHREFSRQIILLSLCILIYIN